MSIKYQLPPKVYSYTGSQPYTVTLCLYTWSLILQAKSVGVWRSAVVKETLRDIPPLEWTGDYYQHSSQPGLRNRRSSEEIHRKLVAS